MKKLKHKQTVTTVGNTTYQLTKSVRARVLITNGDWDSATISFYLKKKPEPLKSEQGYIELVYLKDKDAFHRTIRERVTFHDSNGLGEKFHKDVAILDYQIGQNKETAQFIEQCRTSPLTDDDFAIQYSYDHTWRDVRGERLEQCVHFDYIGGFIQSGGDSDSYSYIYDWEPLKKHLQNHPRVIDFKCEKIPYYNSKFYGQEGLAFKVIIDPTWAGLDGSNRWIHVCDHLGTHQFRKS
jgi:hypothetical protein